MKRVITFGEIMLRLSPPGFQRFAQARSFDVVYGGAESNAAVSLANYGLDSAFVTLLPANPIGDAAVNELRSFGVDTSGIARKGSRVGIYFYEKGVSMRPSKVVYDRKGSAIAEIAPGDLDWDAVFAGADWFHFTGITPALSEGAARETLAAVKAAKAHGVTVSCDLNYRKNLWSREEAGRVMGEIVPMVDVLIANEEDAADVFGIHAAETDISAGKLNVEGYRSVASQLVARFGCKLVAITLRESISASDNNWSGMLLRRGGRGDVCLQEVRHPPGGPPGRRRFLRLRPDLRAPERLQPPGGRGVRRGGLCAQADHRGRRQPRQRRGGSLPHGRKRLRPRAALTI